MKAILRLSMIFLGCWALSCHAGTGAIELDFDPRHTAAFHIDDPQAEEYRASFVAAMDVLAAQESPSLTPAKVFLTGNNLNIRVPRSKARPQDRWIELELSLSPIVDLAKTELQFNLFALDSSLPVEALTVIPSRHAALARVDLRCLNLAAGRLEVSCLEGGELTGKADLCLEAEPLPFNPLTQRQVEVLLDVPEPCADLNLLPVTFGFPMPAGVCWSADELRLVNAAGEEVASQRETTGLWAREGAVQWVRFDSLVDPGQRLFVEAGKPLAVPEVPVKVNRSNDRLTVDTGKALYVLSLEKSPIEEVLLAGQRVVSAQGSRGLYVKDQKDRIAVISEQDALLEVEAEGPLAACVRMEGFYRTEDGEPLARHITRLEFFSGRAEVKVTHTLVLTRDSNEIWFKEVGWELQADAGPDAYALFNSERAKPGSATEKIPLSPGSSAYMLQKTHERFESGSNYFEAVHNGKLLAEGEECGDWAVLAGQRAGLLFACREAARQHPKEFEVRSDLVNLKLFSERAGEELDFHSEVLVKKLQIPADKVADIIKRPNNAQGWAKTHELLFVPFLSAEPEGAIMNSALLSTPPFALPDPAWIAETKAMGAIHPFDTENFPEIEAVIKNRFDTGPLPRGLEAGFYGFIDYFAGPTYGNIHYCSARRYGLTYGTRGNVWLLYARSAERAYREFAEGTNKSYLDNYFCHWGTEDKVQGLYTLHGGVPFSRLPFYWGRKTKFNSASSTDLNQLLWLYHLTGYRRAKDAVVNFNQGMKEAWKPYTASSGTLFPERIIMIYRVLTQCYGFTWDLETRALGEATFAVMSDPEGELLLSKNRPGGSRYKTQVDVRVFLDAWQLHGDPMYYTTLKRVAEHWWHSFVGAAPVRYMNPLGVVSEFLFAQTGDRRMLAGLNYLLYRAGSYMHPGVSMSAHASVFEGLPYAMAVVSKVPANTTRWLAYKDLGNPSGVIIRKNTEEPASLLLRTDPLAGHHNLFDVRSVGKESDIYGHYLLGQMTLHGMTASLLVPHDIRLGDYVITPKNHGEQVVLMDTRHPAVLYAPSYWELIEGAPSCRIYFKMPENSVQPRLFLEGKARVYAPDGSLTHDSTVDGKTGWLDLPADSPGLWSFVPQENKQVCVENLPPFFAFNDAEAFFEPEYPAEPEPLTDKE